MSDTLQQDDSVFELLAGAEEQAEEERTTSRLKSKLLTALVRRQEATGPLRSLAKTQTKGYGLCVFEDLWQRTAPGEGAQSFNCCKMCHARVLAEHLEGAPIYWKHCPYAAFCGK